HGPAAPNPSGRHRQEVTVGWRQLSVCAVLLLAPPGRAATWDEPWQDDVIRKADTLVKAEVLANDGKSVNIKVVETLAGAAVPERATVEGLTLLRLSSFPLADEETKSPYKKAKPFSFSLPKQRGGKPGAAPPPTAGSARLEDGNVYATYRHSFHQALVPQE